MDVLVSYTSFLSFFFLLFSNSHGDATFALPTLSGGRPQAGYARRRASARSLYRCKAKGGDGICFAWRLAKRKSLPRSGPRKAGALVVCLPRHRAPVGVRCATRRRYPGKHKPPTRGPGRASPMHKPGGGPRSSRRSSRVPAGTASACLPWLGSPRYPGSRQRSPVRYAPAPPRQ